jgi:transposase
MVNVGVDLHKMQFTVCVRRCGGEEFRKYPATNEGYEEFLKKAVPWRKAGHEVRVGVESTRNTPTRTSKGGWRGRG